MPEPERPTPILVYDRIEENRRRTRWLLLLFAALCLPFFLVLFLPLAYGLALLSIPLLVHLGVTEPADLRVAGVAVVAGSLATVAAALSVDVLGYRRSTHRVLRASGARPVSRDQEPELFRVVENLSIGAGLPAPRIHVAEKGGPIAFAAGRDARGAALVVTRRLLSLLTRRELEGVVAHELSHIGNQDIRLNTVLAALVATMRRPTERLFRRSRAAGYGCLALSAAGFSLALLTLIGWLIAGIVVGVATEGELWSQLWTQLGEPIEPGGPEVWKALAFELVGLAIGLSFIAGPFYLLVAGHVLGLAVSRAVTRRRELLADADAFLLTKDAEGLATALIKIGAVLREAAATNAALAHMFIVQPEAPPGAGWWEKAFPSHPGIEERVEALSRMGSVSPGVLQRAWHEALHVQPVELASAPPTVAWPLVIRRHFGGLWVLGLSATVCGVVWPVLLAPGLAALVIAALLRRVTALDPPLNEAAVWWRLLLRFRRRVWPLDHFHTVAIEAHAPRRFFDAPPRFRVLLEGPSQRLVIEDHLGFLKARRRAEEVSRHLGVPLDDRSGGGVSLSDVLENPVYILSQLTQKLRRKTRPR